MTDDELEALSRRYGPDVILLLPLRSGRIAVLNCCRELCAIAHNAEEALALWRPSTAHQPKPSIDLEELGLV